MDVLTQLRDGRLAGSRRLDLACGLTEFPREIFDLADTLEVLSLTGNQLHSLPDDFARLKKLRIFFCSDNQFEHLPDVLGDCPQLSMVGFKSNRIAHVGEAALAPTLRWLILTDNRITQLPDSLGRCAPMQKLMLSGNRLHSLPESLTQCGQLEMLRLAANLFETLPDWLLELPRLAWLALAGNPCTPAPLLGSLANAVPWPELELIEPLGEGASGIIHRAHWQSSPEDDVAMKIYKGAMTSDGLPSCEVAAALTAGPHPHLIRVLGHVTGHPSGHPGLVMQRIGPEFTPLAGPPSFETCTRDVYDTACRFSPDQTLRLAHGIAAAAAHLHAHGILHGDLYAHNVLRNGACHALFGDFGAAAFYPPPFARRLEQLEVRAFGLLLEELHARTDWGAGAEAIRDDSLALVGECLQPVPAQRPLFEDITRRLSTLSAQGHR